MEPTPVFLPGKSHGQRRLVGCSSWACKELDITERLCTLEIIMLIQQGKVTCSTFIDFKWQSEESDPFFLVQDPVFLLP